MGASSIRLIEILPRQCYSPFQMASYSSIVAQSDYPFGTHDTSMAPLVMRRKSSPARGVRDYTGWPGDLQACTLCRLRVPYASPNLPVFSRYLQLLFGDLASEKKFGTAGACWWLVGTMVLLGSHPFFLLRSPRKTQAYESGFIMAMVLSVIESRLRNLASPPSGMAVLPHL